MEEDIITMTKKEVERLRVIHKVMDKQITQMKAGEVLGISERHVRRIIKRVREKGDEGIIHGNRGRASPRRIANDQEDRMGRIVEWRYSDFGPTLASEKLWERHGIRIGREKLRQIMIAKGLWKVRRRKDKDLHIWRERKQYMGEMVQMDGSHHDWLEGRGPKLVFMGYVDDATGRVFGRFYDYEGVYSAMDSLKRYIRKYGLPVNLYLDKDSTYKTSREPHLEEELRGQQAQTQFERAAKELGIRIIHAHSPQAKGRIERIFGTLQDRLIKEMRLAGVCDKEEANRFLGRYLPIYNRRFAREAARPEDLHRPLPKEISLKDIFCIKDTRRINDGYIIRWKGKLFLVKKPSSTMRRRKVCVMEDFNGKVRFQFHGRELKCKEVTSQDFQVKKEFKKIMFNPLQRTRLKYVPASTHP